MIDGILNQIEETRTINTTTPNNDETVQVVDVIDSDSDIAEGSNCDMEDSDFMVDYEYMPNLYEEEDERNVISKVR